MINFSNTFRNGRVFVSCSENVDEEKQLDTLVKDVNTICGMTKNTGLWIVVEFKVNLKKVVVMSLKERVDINENDISVLKAELKTLATLRTEVIKHLQRRLQCLGLEKFL